MAPILTEERSDAIIGSKGVPIANESSNAASILSPKPETSPITNNKFLPSAISAYTERKRAGSIQSSINAIMKGSAALNDIIKPEALAGTVGGTVVGSVGGPKDVSGIDLAPQNSDFSIKNVRVQPLQRVRSSNASMYQHKRTKPLQRAETRIPGIDRPSFHRRDTSGSSCSKVPSTHSMSSDFLIRNNSIELDTRRQGHNMHPSIKIPNNPLTIYMPVSSDSDLFEHPLTFENGTPNEKRIISPATPFSSKITNPNLIARNERFCPSSEYALHILFTSFVAETEKIIDALCTQSSNIISEPNLHKILGPNADPAFDQILANIGRVARHRPKPVIDALMYWRRLKYDSANSQEIGYNMALNVYSPKQKSNLPASPEMQRKGSAASNMNLQNGYFGPSFLRKASIDSSNGNLDTRNSSDENIHQRLFTRHRSRKSGNSTPQILTSTEIATRRKMTADRRSLISIYILSRALLSIIVYADPEAFSDDIADRLENVIFNQLKIVEWDNIARSPIKLANWNLFAEILGKLSNFRFRSIKERFIAELEPADGRQLSKEREAHLEMIINGMRYISLHNFPVSAFEESADFIKRLVDLFWNSNGIRLRHAYAYVLNRILLSVFGSISAEVNFPIWESAMLRLYPVAKKMSLKTRNFSVTYPLLCTTLCLSTKEFFLAHFMETIESNLSRFKACPSEALASVTRIIWTYIFRYSESVNTTVKKLDTIFKFVAPVHKKMPFSGDECDDNIISLFRIVGYHHTDYCIKKLLEPSLFMDSSNLNTSDLVDAARPQKKEIALRAFLTIISDLSQSKPPGCPSMNLDDIETIQWCKPKATLLENPLLLHFYNRVSEGVVDYLLRCESILVRGNLDEKFTLEGFNIFQTSEKNKQAISYLFGCLLETIPYLNCTEKHFGKVLDIVCKSLLNQDAHIAVTGRQTLELIARTSKIELIVSAHLQLIKEVYLEQLGNMRNIEEFLDMHLLLLSIWYERAYNKANNASQMTTPKKNFDVDFELTSSWTVLEEVDANGLYFISHHRRSIRRKALAVLRMVHQIDTQLHEIEQQKTKTHCKDSLPRIDNLLESRGLNLLECIEKDCSTVERERVENLKAQADKNLLYGLIESDDSIDTALWFKVFSKFIKILFKELPICVVLCRNTVCSWLANAQPLMESTIEAVSYEVPVDTVTRINHADRSLNQFIEQWKLFLLVACSTLTLGDEDGFSSGKRETRKSHKFDQIKSARNIFQIVQQFLKASYAPIRDAIAIAFSCINVNLLPTLLEDIRPLLVACQTDYQDKLTARVFAIKFRRPSPIDLMFVELTRILGVTVHLLADVEEDQENLIEIYHSNIKFLKIFLSDRDVQHTSEYQKLRRYFCILIENYLNAISKRHNQRVSSSPQSNLVRKDSITDRGNWIETYFSFELKLSCYRLLETWCPFASDSKLIRLRDSLTKQLIFEQVSNDKDRASLAAQLEIEKHDLEVATIQAMSKLATSGPLRQVIQLQTDKRAMFSFNIAKILKWIDELLASDIESQVTLASATLKNLIRNNSEFQDFLMEIFRRCYVNSCTAKISSHYFYALVDVTLEDLPMKIQTYELLVLCLLKISDEDIKVRKKATAAFKFLIKKYYNTDYMDDFVCTNSSSVSIYKRNAYLIATKFSEQHPELSHHMLSLLFLMFRNMEDIGNQRRDVIFVMFPLFKQIQLRKNQDDEIEATGYMVLINLLDFTISHSSYLQNEVEALWAGLATGENSENVKIIVEFCIQQCLQRRDPAVVLGVEQALIFVARASDSADIVTTLFAQLQPKLMIPYVKESPDYLRPEGSFPFMADLDTHTKSKQKLTVFSQVQVAVFLLTYILIEQNHVLSGSQYALLLTIVFSQLDHYSSFTRDRMIQLLIVLLSLLLKAYEDKTMKRKCIDLIGKVKGTSKKEIWTYEDLNLSNSTQKAPKYMVELVQEIVEIIEPLFRDIRKLWLDSVLTWGTACPVRHVACRSFQIMKCIDGMIEKDAFTEMLARLSNTISDPSRDIQTFALQILSTIRLSLQKSSSDQLLSVPQLFWASVSILDTVNEREYQASLAILSTILEKCNLEDERFVSSLTSSFPSEWSGEFQGLQDLLLRGLRSCHCYLTCTDLLDKLAKVPDSWIVGSKCRLLLLLVANLPRFVQSMSDEEMLPATRAASEDISKLAKTQGQIAINKILQSFAKQKFRSAAEFRRQMVTAIQNAFMADHEAEVMTLLIGLLLNPMERLQSEILSILLLIVPATSFEKICFAGMGADLLSPLLRLLQTDLAPMVLDVLDEIPQISVNPNDKLVLRIAITNSSAFTHELEEVPSMFGLPEESGWTRSTASSQRTRANLQAVFSTVTTSDTEMNDETFGLEFDAEEDVVPDDESSLMDNIKIQGDSLGNVVSALHDLDLYFAEEDSSALEDNNSFKQENRRKRRVGSVGAEERMSYYPEYYPRAAAILQQSLHNIISDGKDDGEIGRSPSVQYHDLTITGRKSLDAPTGLGLTNIQQLSDDTSNDQHYETKNETIERDHGNDGNLSSPILILDEDKKQRHRRSRFQSQFAGQGHNALTRLIMSRSHENSEGAMTFSDFDQVMDSGAFASIRSNGDDSRK